MTRSPGVKAPPAPQTGRARVSPRRCKPAGSSSGTACSPSRARVAATWLARSTLPSPGARGSSWSHRCQRPPHRVPVDAGVGALAEAVRRLRATGASAAITRRAAETVRSPSRQRPGRRRSRTARPHGRLCSRSTWAVPARQGPRRGEGRTARKSQRCAAFGPRRSAMAPCEPGVTRGRGQLSTASGLVVSVSGSPSVDGRQRRGVRRSESRRRRTQQLPATVAGRRCAALASQPLIGMSDRPVSGRRVPERRHLAAELEQQPWPRAGARLDQNPPGLRSRRVAEERFSWSSGLRAGRTWSGRGPWGHGP